MTATVVVNATGAWAPITAALGRLPPSRVRVRPGKGIHVAFDRRLSNYGIMTEAIDGRQIFLEPWQNMSVIGTTDDDYYGDLNDVTATSDEVRYLVQGIARIFPSIRQARAIGTWAGVRPTLYTFGTNEDDLSREHVIVDHAADGAPNVYSMIGGKLASYRLFAQEMSDRIASLLAPASRCTTHEKPLPGGDRVPDALALAEAHELTPVGARRLVYRHGSRAQRILSRIAKHPRERAVVCACEPVLEAEVRYAIKEEMARTVDDVARRTRLGLGACGGMRCAARCGQIVADVLGASPRTGQAQARAFLERQAKMRVVAMGPEQARQEALALAQMRATLGTRGDDPVRQVVVVGGGIAGTAAALAAAHAGADVRVVLGGSGASTLSPGALDDAPWEKPNTSTVGSSRLDAARMVLGALGAFVLPENGAVVATTAGIVRRARGIDLGLLDLGPLSRATVLVPGLERGAWDGPSLARAWNDAPAARERSLSFVHAHVQLTRFIEEHSTPDAEIAARHDDPTRLAWLAAQLKRALESQKAPVAAVLLPPWLGVERARARALSEQLGVPCGEALMGSGGPSGLRFEKARDRAFAKARVETMRGWVRRVARAESGLKVELENGDAIDARDAVVLATGGLIGGGLAYTPSGSVLAAELPPSARPLLCASIDASLVIGARGVPLEVPASLFGAAPESHAWPFVEDPLLDHAGALVDRGGRAAGGLPGLFAAGELVADEPRTWLRALEGGARAGLSAAAG